MTMINGAPASAIFVQTLNISADKVNYFKNCDSNVIETSNVSMKKNVPLTGRMIIKTNNTKSLVLTNKFCQGNLEVINSVIIIDFFIYTFQPICLIT